MRILPNLVPPPAPVQTGTPAPVTAVDARLALALATAQLPPRAEQAGATASALSPRPSAPPLLPASAAYPTSPKALVVSAAPTARASGPVSLTPPNVAMDRITLTTQAVSGLPPSVSAPVIGPESAGTLPQATPDLRILDATVQKQDAAGAQDRRPAPMADRVSLSAAAGASIAAKPAQVSQPPGQLLLNVLEAVTGEPASQLQMLEFRAPSAPATSATYSPQLLSDSSRDVLQLLSQGAIRTMDGKMVPFDFALTAHRGGSPAAAVLTSLVLNMPPPQGRALLDYPGPAADLAGQVLNFQAVLDPRALWPLQSFLLSGLLTLRRARDEEPEDELYRLAEWSDDADQDEQGEPRKRKRQARPVPEDEISPLPEDGGPPIISGRRWLELEMRHLRVQMRQWMGLSM